MDGYLSERATAEAALAVAALGPLAVAAGALGLIAILIVRRRRGAIVLARGRGASGGQLLWAQLVEGLLVTVPAALVGLWLATTLVPVRANGASSIGAILVALAATAILVVTTWPLARRARRQLERDDPTVTKVSPRRLVFELLVIGLAITGAWLLRERGLTTEGSAGDVRAFDPFLALAPVLVGVAVGLITIRLYPYPVRAIGWLAARGRGLVAVLGLRTIGRDPTAAYLPLLVLMLTVAIGSFTSVVRVTVDRGQVADSWRQVGADYRIENSNGGTLAPRVDPHAIPGVGAVAAGYGAPAVPLILDAGRAASTSLLAIEPGAFQSVIADFADRPDACRRLSRAHRPARRPAPRTTRSRPSSRRIRRPANRPSPIGDVVGLSVAGKRVWFRIDRDRRFVPRRPDRRARSSSPRTNRSPRPSAAPSSRRSTSFAATPRSNRRSWRPWPASRPRRRSIHATTDTRPSTTRRSSPVSPEASGWRWRSRSSTRRWPSSRSCSSTPSGGRASSGSCGRSG